MFHEPTLISDLPYFGARYPSEDITEHLLSITQLRSMQLRDKFSYTHISVIDARHDIIGPHFADSAPIPVIDMKDIILHEKYYRHKDDGLDKQRGNPNHDAGNIPLGVQVAGNIVSGIIDTESCQVKAYKCMIHLTDGAYIYRFKSVTYSHAQVSASIPQDISFQEQMDIVHSRHLSFLEQQDSISRDLFTELAKTYEHDYTLPRQTFATMIHYSATSTQSTNGICTSVSGTSQAVGTPVI